MRHTAFGTAHPALRSPTLLWVLLAFISLALIAAPAEAAKKVKVKMSTTAAEAINPDYQGRPSPVNVIVFQLASPDAFSNADFFSLFDAESGVLGGDLLGRTQMLLKPGEVRDWDAEFDSETRYVGVVAAYRDIENAQWRSMIELPKRGLVRRLFKKNKLRVDVGELAVTINIK